MNKDIQITKDRLMIGDSRINFSQDYIHVGDLSFKIWIIISFTILHPPFLPKI